MRYTLQSLAEHTGARLLRAADRDVVVGDVVSWEEAAPGRITVALNERVARELAQRPASPVLTSRELASHFADWPVLVASHPRLAFGRLLGLFSQRPSPAVGVHATAWVDPQAQLGAEVKVGPCAVVEAGAVVGDRVEIGPGAYVGVGVRIGADSRLGPHVVLYDGVILGQRVWVQAGAVIGGDGFGYEPTPEGFYHLPHIGTVVLEDDVDVGANSTIDRATVGVTRIGRGTKIDNLVQIGHNVQIGPGSLLAGMSGVAGSAVLEAGVTLAGQAGVADHARVGRGTIVAGQALVAGQIGPGLMVSGSPAREHHAELRRLAATNRLPELLERVRALEKQIADWQRPAHPGGNQAGGNRGANP